MAITRRQFLKYAAASAAALGLSELELFKLAEKVMANPTGPTVIGLQAQCCNGDLTALANVMNSIPPTAVGMGHTLNTYAGGAVERYLAAAGGPTSTVDDVLIDVINLTYHPTVCAPSGALAYVEGVINASDDSHFLLIEGSIPVGAQDGWTVGEDACNVGDKKGDGTGEAETMVDALCEVVNKGNTTAVLAWGTCAAYGGIPAARNGNAKAAQRNTPKYRSTGAMGVSDALHALRVAGKITLAAGSMPAVVNIPGCPTRPEDLFLVVAQAIISIPGLVGTLQVERASDPLTGRPKKILGINLFGETNHFHCSRRGAYSTNNIATSFEDTDGKCLMLLGCKGPETHGSCQRYMKHQWNPVAGVEGATSALHQTASWPTALPNAGGTLGTVSNDGGTSCIKKGHPCIGCKESGFPDRFAPLVDYLN